MTTSHTSQANQSKRQDFSTVRFIPTKPVKRRASQACIQCRNRKVRCDFVLQSPAFCTNCRLDGIVCEVSRCKRRRPHHAVAASPRGPGGAGPGVQDIKSASPTTGVYDDTLREGDMHSGIVENGREIAQFSDIDSNTLTSPNTTSNRSIDGTDLHVLPSFPPFIKSLPADLDAEDLRYLYKRGCFSLLPSGLEKIAIRRYAEFIHPLVPVIDLDDFVGAVFGNMHTKISLLLYHAVMCAGLAAVEIETIQKYGYASKPAARKECYTKAKVLLDLDVETDRLTTCQAAIMFISWSTNNHIKDAFHWLGVAISQACSLKIQRPDSCCSLPKSEQALRQRIWWSLIMRECDVCLSMGRPPRISPHGTPMLQQEAFVNSARATDYSELPETGKLRRDAWIQRRLELACIEKAKLALIIYRILRLPRSGGDSSINASTRNARVWQLESELKDWRLQLPMELTSFNPALNLSDDSDRSLQLTISLIHLTQLMALILLHKSEVSLAGWTENNNGGDDWDEDDGGAAMDAQGHTRSMRQAAYEMTVIHKTLHDQRLTPSIPTIGIATVCAAVFVHLLDARSAPASIRRAGLEQLDTCVSVLRELGQINETAIDVTRIVESAVQAAREFSSSAPPPVSQKQPLAGSSHNATSNANANANANANTNTNAESASRSTEEAQFTTHSYMEGVVPGRSENPNPAPPPQSSSSSSSLSSSSLEAPAHANGHGTNSYAFAQAQVHDLFGSLGQDLFCGMENFFDFELDENPLFLAEA